MSLVESIEKFLSFANRDLIAYDIILGALLGGIGVGFSQASFVDDFPNIIELIIGSMMLLNEGSKPLLRSLGFVLTADGFSSFIKKVFTSEECENCIPIECLELPPPRTITYTDPTTKSDPPNVLGPCVFFKIESPLCRQYFEKLKKYEVQHVYDTITRY